MRLFSKHASTSRMRDEKPQDRQTVNRRAKKLW